MTFMQRLVCKFKKYLPSSLPKLLEYVHSTLESELLFPEKEFKYRNQAKTLSSAWKGIFGQVSFYLFALPAM